MTLDQIKIPKESTTTEHAAKTGPWSSKPKAPKERTGVALTLERAVAQLWSVSLTGSKPKAPKGNTCVVSTPEKNRWESHVQEDIIDGVMELAAQKLSKSKTFDPKVTNHALVVMSQRFGLDICFGHPDAVSYIETGVASHLRVRCSTTEDRIWSFTGYPSEPLLSCVAAILLHETPNHLKQALQVLSRNRTERRVN
ncbi:hypothetical protein BDR05DRAFT_196597 [Suillus weaverae]|nr:hypothetical protein BDR05DRAFT_196597 [Suillus weaverae]